MCPAILRSLSTYQEDLPQVLHTQRSRPTSARIDSQTLQGVTLHLGAPLVKCLQPNNRILPFMVPVLSSGEAGPVSVPCPRCRSVGGGRWTGGHLEVIKDQRLVEHRASPGPWLRRSPDLSNRAA